MTATKEKIEPATAPQWELSLRSRAGKGRTGCLHARSYTYQHRKIKVYIVCLPWYMIKTSIPIIVKISSQPRMLYKMWLKCAHLFCALSNVSPGVESLDLSVDDSRGGHFACTLLGDDLFQANTKRADCRLTQGHQLIGKNLWYTSNPSAHHLNTHTRHTCVCTQIEKTTNKKKKQLHWLCPDRLSIHQPSSTNIIYK